MDLVTSHTFHWAGLKSMVVQGVKNPMVDLQSLEDKILDEVMLETVQHYMKTVTISMFEFG